MKTAISIPDDVFAQAEKVARLLKKSRSELYSEALREYLARHGPEKVTEALNRLYAKSGAANDFRRAATRETLRRSGW
jgi:Arc/MetJ family transcription regulator